MKIPRQSKCGSIADTTEKGMKGNEREERCWRKRSRLSWGHHFSTDLLTGSVRHAETYTYEHLQRGMENGSKQFL